MPGYNSLTMNIDFIIPEQSQLGRGGTASIFSGNLINQTLIQMHGTSEIAVKVFPKDESMLSASSIDQKSNFMYEVALMNLIPASPNIVKFIGHMESPELAIIMKKYEGSLDGLISKKVVPMGPALAFKIATDIASGMNLIHNMNVLHLDVKPHNMLWERTSDGGLNFCICDFGFASLVGESRNVISGLQIPKAVGITIRYTAPEVFLNLAMRSNEAGRAKSESCKKIDVYAYGLSMYFVLLGANYWPNIETQEIMVRVRQGVRPSIGDIPALLHNDPRSKAIITLIEQCWNGNPNERPSFGTIVQSLAALK